VGYGLCEVEGGGGLEGRREGLIEKVIRRGRGKTD
jgi:hypothetical protein